MAKRVVIVGGGAAGMQTALELKARGLEPVIVERDIELGGKVRGWHKLFPSFTPADEVMRPIAERIKSERIRCFLGQEVRQISPDGVTLRSNERIPGEAVVVATGFTLFDAHRKQEYGYGLYNNVITSVDLERMMNSGKVMLADGTEPRRIAILHCVGSRDEKVGQRHCSKVCCITGVKQAIELKQMFPTADVFNFYMDIRMFGPGYEELYREAQQKYNVHFVRGRISEAAETINQRIQIKAEDTLTGRPLRMTVDMLVLLVGMSPNYENEELAERSSLALAPNGFFKYNDSFLGAVRSNQEGIFYVGAATAPKSLADTLAEASMTASAVAEYIKDKFNHL
ncbi:MAG: CoB--CoM heterodisulfide reductase iron-sulfur subunit A family protein [Alistipes sp.]|nr:CoB--CoM heterodisulfide reductase iron-sulfur subunit A family protein [Alistipes sp.]